MAQVKPALTLDVNVGPTSNLGIGGSSTSLTPRSRQAAIASKAQSQIRASAQPPDPSLGRPPTDGAYTADPQYGNDLGIGEEDQGGFSSDDDGQDAYAAATRRLRAGSASVGARATRDNHHSGKPQRRVKQYRSDAADDESESSDDTHGYTPRHHRASDGLEDEISYDGDNYVVDDKEEEDDEEMLDDVDEGELSSSPSIDENIDFDLVYALHNFIATIEGQATVHKGNHLTLLDDSNSYWWLVRVLRTQEVGYIPAENIETPFERLARLNKHRNVDLTSATDDDHIQVPEKIFKSHLVKARHATGTSGFSVHSGKLSALSRRALGVPAPLTKEQKRNKRGLVFGPSTYYEHSGPEYSSEEEDGYDDEEAYELDENGEPIYEYEDEEMSSEEEEPTNAFARMEPDDGMGWDGGEAERIQREQEAHHTAQAGERWAEQDDQRGQSRNTVETEANRQLQSESAPTKVAAAGSAEPAAERANGRPQQSGPTLQRGPQPAQQTAGSRGPPGGSQHEEAPLDTTRQQLQNQQKSLAAGQVRAGHLRTTSADRSITSVSSGGPAQDVFSGTSGSRSSTFSTSGFLPSQLQAQRERSASDASATSGTPTSENPPSVISPDSKRDEKRRSNWRSKADDVSESGSEERSAKKRSGVFSLFSRSKDKKDRKSGSFGTEDRDSILTGRSSEDSYAAPARGRASPAANGAVAAANAGFAPGQSVGMGRAVQERDRAQQEAYQRQFLSGPLSSDSDTGRMSRDQSGIVSARTSKPARPGSLIGPSGSTPMLSVLRVFAGEGVESDSTFKTVLLNEGTPSTDLLRQALQRFAVPVHERDKYVLTIKRLEGSERPLDGSERPLQLFNELTEIMSDGQVNVPSVKRSSVGSISSIASNLSMHPAIARLGNDFSDDHAVKFYISRKQDLPGHSTPSASFGVDELRRSADQADLSESQDFSNPTNLSLVQDGQHSSRSSAVTAETSETIQSPTAQFSLRLVIFPADLPEGLVFDPQTPALIPQHALDHREPQYREPAEGVSQSFRERILTFPRNTTVAEVVEAGLNRFGIVEGVVEGGDDVEDRPSRRKSRLHVKYGLAVEDADGQRPLGTTSKILDAYATPPIFKTVPGGNNNKRRSLDAAQLLGASDDISPSDPVFILRQNQLNGKLKSARSLSPSESVLQAKQEAKRQAESHSLAAAAGSLRSQRAPGADDSAAAPQSLVNTQGMTRQEIIAAQRAAAHERRAAVLGARRNTEQGVDVVLSDQARIRSSKQKDTGRFRYSYLPVEGEEQDISHIIEEVLKEKDPRSKDAARGLGSNAGRPGLTSKKSTDTSLDVYASAPSSPGLTSPLSLEDVHYDLQSPAQMSQALDSVAPLSIGGNKARLTTQSPASGHVPSSSSSQNDLLETFVRHPNPTSSAIGERIDQVLDRVAEVKTPASRSPAPESVSSGTIRAGSRTAGPSPAPSVALVSGRGTPTKGSSVVGPAATAAAAAASASAAVSAASASGPSHRKQASTGSEVSNSRDTASPLTIGTGSAATHATNTTMPTPLSTLVAGGAMGSAFAFASSAGTGSRSGRSFGAATPGSTATDGRPSSLSLASTPDDLGLDHLYTIVDAAARRDPRKVRLMTHGSTSSISGDINGRPSTRLAHELLADTPAEMLRPEAGGLFAPSLPFVEDKKTREAYGAISTQLGAIDETLDQVLLDVMRVF